MQAVLHREKPQARPSSRYLTEAEKAKELEVLESIIATANDRVNDGLDLAMVSYMRRINALPGLVTVQSCSGHPELGGENIQRCGSLWIRLSETAMHIFEEHAFELASAKHVEHVYRRYQSYYQDVVEIWFISRTGEGDIVFNEAIENVTSFFESLFTT